MQTGVKSAGWEKRIAQLFPSHWWKSMSPCVVFALKLGASEPRRRRGWEVGVARVRLKASRGVKCLDANANVDVEESRGSCDVARNALRENEVAIREDSILYGKQMSLFR